MQDKKVPTKIRIIEIYADTTAYRDFVPGALKTVPHLVVATNAAGRAVAFMGIDGQKIEMLFVSPEVFGLGFGRRLVEYGLSALGVTAVDVNEQNPQARGFYEHMGFRVVGRSERDGQGTPHSILHMMAGVHAEPQSAQSFLGMGKFVPRASTPYPLRSLREQTTRTSGVDSLA